MFRGFNHLTDQLPIFIYLFLLNDLLMNVCWFYTQSCV